jgi:hypothetical protein
MHGPALSFVEGPADAPRHPMVPILADSLSFSRLTLLVFLTFQAADGLMTYAVASQFGAGVEGNPLIATWMHLVGVGPALLLAKIASAAGGILLYMRGVHFWLAACTAFYAFGAVIPWLRVLAADVW